LQLVAHRAMPKGTTGAEIRVGQGGVNRKNRPAPARAPEDRHPPPGATAPASLRAASQLASAIPPAVARQSGSPPR